ncbi:unnamed protein product [Rangifer tarandus platyrhynchus]|uniref:Uncharacterized protein n=2 Tax=Rangifer tarandus platyrhynchus TaxID=3082113 RepID=A0ABN8ZLW7_RANTA|nr:unnamed protein product [Rangifer tarandus platyrhynchus]
MTASQSTCPPRKAVKEEDTPTPCGQLAVRGARMGPSRPLWPKFPGPPPLACKFPRLSNGDDETTHLTTVLGRGIELKCLKCSVHSRACINLYPGDHSRAVLGEHLHFFSQPLSALLCGRPVYSTSFPLADVCTVSSLCWLFQRCNSNNNNKLCVYMNLYFGGRLVHALQEGEVRGLPWRLSGKESAGHCCLIPPAVERRSSRHSY